MIRRRHAHLAFSLLFASIAGALAWQAWQLHSTEELITELAAVPDTLTPDELASLQPDDEHPAVLLALGSALAKGHHMAEAEALLDSMISNTNDQQTRIGAQYNLANLYLSAALNSNDPVSSRTRPMVELAKQRYRDLLAEVPEYWPARYNLESALRLTPEGSDRADDEPIDPVKSVNVIVPGFEKKDLP